MHKKRITYIILLMGLLGLFSGIWVVNQKSHSSDPILGMPYSAELANSTITYTTEVERVVDRFRVTLDLTETAYTSANKVNMTITYSNATVETYDLSGPVANVWTFSKYFDYQAPLETQHFKLFVWLDDLLLDESYDQYFEILNCPPKFAINLLNTTLYRNSTMYFNITPTDVETPYQQLDWSWQILFGELVVNSSVNKPQLTGLSHFFSAGTADSRLGEYTIKGMISDTDGGTTTTYASFTLLNNAPIVSDYRVIYPDEENPNYILRQVETFTLKVNVSDVEKDADDINLRVQIIDEEGNLYGKTSSMVETSTPWNYEGNITLSKDREIGEYTCYIIPYELVGGIEYSTNKSFTFILGNNLPDPNNITYTINGEIPSGIGLRIKEFEQINFAINVSNVDIEGIDVVRIHLISPNNEEFDYPFTNDQNENYIEYNLSAKDLAYGQWTVWIYVVDTDGVEVHTTFPYSFDIMEEKFNKALPWIMFVVGATIALGISMAVLGTRYVNLRRNFDNLLSRSGDYVMPDTKSQKASPQPKKTPSSEKTESKAKSSGKKKKSVTKKHELFRKIKKK